MDVEPESKAPGYSVSNLYTRELLSSSDSNFNLRHYSMVVASGATARTGSKYPPAKNLLKRLRGLLHYCPNVVSLALCRLGPRSFPYQLGTRRSAAS
jgi:hypothetical protein